MVARKGRLLLVEEEPVVTRSTTWWQCPFTGSSPNVPLGPRSLPRSVCWVTWVSFHHTANLSLMTINCFHLPNAICLEREMHLPTEIESVVVN